MMAPRLSPKVCSNTIGKIMATSFDNPSETIKNAEQLLLEILDITSEFEAKVRYKCREGCGTCCLKPTIEAQTIEMMPLAKHLIDCGRFEEIYEKLASSGDGPCEMFQAHEDGAEKGRCTAYEFRPSVCRLFGFSAVKKKVGPPQLVNCHWQKKLYPNELAQTQEAINAGMSVPIISEYRFQFQNIAASTVMGTPLPINQALKTALEKQMMVQGYHSSEEVSPTELRLLTPGLTSDLHLELSQN